MATKRFAMASLFALLILLAGGCAQLDPKLQRVADRYWSPAALAIPNEPVVLPMPRDRQGHVFVEAQIGSANHLLLLDTGAPRIELDPALIDDHQLETFQMDLNFIGSNQRQWTVGVLPELRLGSAQVREISVVFNSWRDWSIQETVKPSLHRSVDGVLGGPLLERLGMQIDFHEGRVYLGKTDAPDSAYSVRLLKRKMGRLYVKIRIDDAPHWLMVDTGADKTWMKRAVMLEHGIGQTGQGIGAIWGDREQPHVAGVIPKLQIGSATIHEMHVQFRDQPDVLGQSERRIAGRRVDGVLAADLLSLLGARIDYRRGRLYIRGPRSGEPASVAHPPVSLGSDLSKLLGASDLSISLTLQNHLALLSADFGAPF